MNLLIISNADSCRSRIAQALLSSFGKGMKVYSAGTMRKPPVNHVFSAISSTSIFVPKNKTYDDTRRSCRNYYVLQGTQSNL